MCNHRVGVTQGGEKTATTEDAFITEGVAPYRLGIGDDLEVQSIGGAALRVKRGKAYLFNADGIGQAGLYLVENTEDYTLSVPAGYGSVVLVLDLDIPSDDVGSNIVSINYVPGVSDRPPSDADIASALGGNKRWLRLADYHFDTSTNTMSVVDRRVYIAGAHLREAKLHSAFAKKNLLMNSDFMQKRWGWWCNDWSKVAISENGEINFWVDTDMRALNYTKVYRHPDDRYLWGGKYYVLSFRIHRTYGTTGLKVYFKWFDGSVWHTMPAKWIYLPGSTDTTWRHFAYHFRLPDDPNYQWGEFVFETTTGGNGSFWLGDVKLEGGVLPTPWIPRPLAPRQKHVIYWPWDTATDGWPNLHEVNALSYGATKRTVLIEIEAHLRDDAAWSALAAQEKTEGAWQQAMNCENETKGRGAMHGNVQLSSDYKFRMFITRPSAQTKVSLELVRFWEYV